MKIFMSMIEAEFCLFDVKIKESSGKSSVLSQASLGVTPKGFNSVNMVGTSRKFIFTVMHSEMAFISDINETVVSFPAICMDDAFVGDLTFDNGLQSRSGTIFKNISKNQSTAFEHSDYWHLVSCSSASFASNSSCAKIALVDFDNAFKRCSSIAFVSNPDAYCQQVTINCGAMNTHDLSNLSGFQIEREESIELSKLVIRKSGTFKVTISH